MTLQMTPGTLVFPGSCLVVSRNTHEGSPVSWKCCVALSLSISIRTLSLASLTRARSYVRPGQPRDEILAPKEAAPARPRLMGAPTEQGEPPGERTNSLQRGSTMHATIYGGIVDGVQ